MGIIVLIVLIVIIKNRIQARYHDERNFDVSKKGTYGTAKELKEKQAKKLTTADGVHSLLTISSNISNDEGGIILGKYSNGNIVMKNCIPKENMNLFVCGAPGSGKSYMFVRPYLAQCIRREESFIVTDPSGELLESMGGYAKQCGYKIRVFNLVDPKRSDSWNVTKEVGNDQYLAQVAASTIIKNTITGRVGDPFWDNGEQNLLKALLLYITSPNYESKDKSLGAMYKLLAASDFENTTKLKLEQLPVDHNAKMPFNIFAQSPANVQASFASGLATRLQIFQSEAIRNMTSKDCIDLAAPGLEKCAYFIIMSDQDSTYQLLSSLFFSFLFIKLANEGKQHENQLLPCKVNIVLDELPSIGTIPDLGRKLATVRKYGVNVVPIIQLISQLDNRYSPEEREEIMGCCDTQIWLGSNDKTSAESLSERSGTMTVDVSSKSEQLSMMSGVQLTSSVGKRSYLNYDEVMRLPLNEAVIVLRGQNVMRLKKYKFNEHPDFKEVKKAPVITISNYEPNLDHSTPETQEKSQPQPKPKKQKEQEEEAKQQPPQNQQKGQEENSNGKKNTKNTKDKTDKHKSKPKNSKQKQDASHESGESNSDGIPENKTGTAKAQPEQSPPRNDDPGNAPKRQGNDIPLPPTPQEPTGDSEVNAQYTWGENGVPVPQSETPPESKPKTGGRKKKSGFQEKEKAPAFQIFDDN